MYNKTPFTDKDLLQRLHIHLENLRQAHKQFTVDAELKKDTLSLKEKIKNNSLLFQYECQINECLFHMGEVVNFKKNKLEFTSKLYNYNKAHTAILLGCNDDIKAIIKNHTDLSVTSQDLKLKTPTPPSIKHIVANIKTIQKSLLKSGLETKKIQNKIDNLSSFVQYLRLREDISAAYIVISYNKDMIKELLQESNNHLCTVKMPRSSDDIIAQVNTNTLPILQAPIALRRIPRHNNLFAIGEVSEEQNQGI